MNQEETLFRLCAQKLTAALPVLRKMNNLTQKKMGEIIGVSRQTITNIESGKSEMKWSVFLAIMFIFSLDADSAEYIKRLDIPFTELKTWLQQKREE